MISGISSKRRSKPDISHKTERGLIRVDIRNEGEVLKAFKEITAGMNGPENYVLEYNIPHKKRMLTPRYF